LNDGFIADIETSLTAHWKADSDNNPATKPEIKPHRQEGDKGLPDIGENRKIGLFMFERGVGIFCPG
jgi:hypothetical protein